MLCVGFLNRFMETPLIEHLANEKCVLTYVKGTLNFSLKYKKGRKLLLESYCDKNYGGDIGDMKGTLGVFFFLGRNLVTWML